MPATEESLELKRGKEVSRNKSCSYEITKGGEENATGKYAREEGAWSLNPSRYSKWYRVKPNGGAGTWLVSGKSESLGAPIHYKLWETSQSKTQPIKD